MELALELLYEEEKRLQEQISITGDPTGIYLDRWNRVNSSIIELDLYYSHIN